MHQSPFAWIVAATLSAVVMVFPQGVYAHADGINGAAGALYFSPNFNTAKSCTGCHRLNPGQLPPTVTLEGPSTVQSGQTVEYTFTVLGRAIDYPETGSGGLDVGVNDVFSNSAQGNRQGNFVVLEAGTKIGADRLLKTLRELTHTERRALSTTPDGAYRTAVFRFGWTAPVVAADKQVFMHIGGVMGDGIDKVPQYYGDSSLQYGDGSGATVLPILVSGTGAVEARLDKVSYAGIAGETVSFDGTASLGDGLSYSWDFGDGATGMDAVVDHVYEAHGDYVVTLHVTDGQGQTGWIDAPVTIKARPIAHAGGPYGGAAGQTISFDASGSSDPDGAPGDVLVYTWDFGDGQGSLPSASSTTTHAYTSAGIWTVTLTLVDADGLGATATSTADISANGAPDVITQAATNVTDVAAILHAAVDAKGDTATTAMFQYDPILANALSGHFDYSTVAAAVAPSPLSLVDARVTGLECATTYYYRAYAESSESSLFTVGTLLSFETAPCPGAPLTPTATAIVTRVDTAGTTHIGGLPVGDYVYVVTKVPLNGTAVVDQQNGIVTYTPAPGFLGADSLTVTVINDLSQEGSVDIAVTVETAPVPAPAPAQPAATGGGGGGGSVVGLELVWGWLAALLLVGYRRRSRSVPVKRG